MDTALPTTDAPRAVLDALTRCELFRGMSESALRRIAAEAATRTLRRGAVLWTRDDPPSVVAVVAAGGVRCSSRPGDPRRWVSDVVRAGGICGLAACVDGGTASCHAVAIERSRLILLPVESVREAMARDPDFARRVASVLARDVRRALTTCEDLVLRTPLQRLARYLEARADAASVVALGESQTDVAAQLGTVREVVARGLTRLEGLGVLTREGRTVRILRRDELTRIGAGTNS